MKRYLFALLFLLMFAQVANAEVKTSVEPVEVEESQRETIAPPEDSEATQAPAEEKQYEGSKIDQVMEMQKDILAQLRDIRAQLDVVKVRCTK